jgi:hypothetical protein
MTTDDGERDAVLERLRKLESGTRRLRWIVVALVGLMLASPVAVFLYLQRMPQRHLEVAVSRLTVVDDAGKPRAVLAVSGDDAGVTIYDNNGKQRAVLGIAEGRAGLKLASGRDQPQVNLNAGMDGAELVFQDGGGKERASLGVVRDQPSLLLRDAAALPRAELSAKENGGRLQFRDENGKLRATWAAGGEKTELTFANAEGKPDVLLSSTEGRNSLVLSNSHAVPQLQIGVTGNEPALLLLDEAGRRRADLRIQSDGTSGLFMMNQQEKARIELGVSGAEGIPILALRDEDLKLRGVFRLEGDGTPRFALLSASEAPRCILQAGSDGSELVLNGNRPGLGAALTVLDDKNFLVFLDGNENQRLGLGIIDNNPGMVFFDEQGKPIWTAP